MRNDMQPHGNIRFVKSLTQDMPGAITLALLAGVVGLASGVVCALFHAALTLVVRVHDQVTAQAQASPWPMLLLLVGGSALATGIAASLVRRLAPAASGSGIPHVEAVLEGEMRPAKARLIPIKFVGGCLAIGSGLALGREGPSVQMGAAIGNLVGHLSRRDLADRRALLAGGAGAGLATAFNAPGAGAVFVLEELVGRFDARIVLVAIGSTVGAIFVSRWILGGALDFPAPDFASGGSAALPLFLVLGLVVGLASVIYNRCLLGTLRLMEKVPGPAELRAAVIGGLAGLVAYVAPDMVGGGDDMVTRLIRADVALTLIPMLFLVRLLFSTLSYAADTPGGLFAPMLALGALVGLGFGLIAAPAFPGLGVQAGAYAVVAMGAFFAGSVRAPLTGIVLVTEMTGGSALILPLLSASFGAMLVTEMLGEPPVYAQLRERAARSER
ncbi:H(+)/Cl(-) exchange transporter ClcA (plasmid) [Paracoccaceae bacterium]|nr:H(+)/Cl(-) exchange transporter ClcA [Paracoccaceae bacterium]